MVVQYKCPRCLHKFINTTNIRNHANTITKCVVDKKHGGIDIVLIDHLECILRNKDSIEFIKLKLKVDKLTEENKKLKMQNCLKDNSEDVSNLKNKSEQQSINFNNNIKGDNNKVINIVINNYNTPNLEYIENKICKKLIKNIDNAIPGMIKYIYNNSEHPENHILKKTNKKDSCIQVKQGDKWVDVRCENILNELIENVYLGYENGEVDSEQLQPLIDKIADDTKFKKQTIKDLMIECYNMRKR